MRKCAKAVSIVKWSLSGVVTLIVALLIFAAIFDWNAAKGPIARFISQRIDREVTIEGLHARLLSFPARITVTGLRIANPYWVGDSNMLELKRVAIKYKTLSWLTGAPVLLRVDIEEPKVNLVREASGRANWQLGRQGRKDVTSGSALPPDLPVVRNFNLRGGQIEVVDELRKLTFNGEVEAGERIGERDRYPFKLSGQGKLNRRPFRALLSGGPLINVERDKPYFFDAQVQAGATHVDAEGAVIKPFDLGRLQVNLDITGDDMADLYYLCGLALPNTPPYKVKGRLQRDGTRIRIEGFNGKVGDSQVAGDLSVDTSSGRPFLRGELVSKSLDLDDLATPLGGAPQSEGNETISARQRSIGAAMAKNRRLFPDAKLQVGRVRAMDADVKFRAESVNARKIPIRQVDVHVKLDHGVLTIDPASFVLPQGRFAGSVRLDARPGVPQSQLDFRVTGVQLDQFKPRDGRPPLEGTVQGRIQLKGSGDSVLRTLASGNGSVTAVVPRGEIREAFAELTGINVARGLGLLLTKDQTQVPVRCGVADFELRDGKLSARNIVFDTQNVLITGKGDIRLDTETADLTIKGQPKKLRLLRVRAPITIKGPLRKPEIGVEGEETAKQGVAAALAALIAPLAAVVAFVDPGLARNADCSALFEQAKAKGAPAPGTAGSN